MRDWRKGRPLSADARRKDIARSIAGVNKRRGVILPKPCENCGSDAAQMHHDDYSQPLTVRWFCPACHSGFHREIERPTGQLSQ